jgi:fumarate reductase subunit C
MDGWWKKNPFFVEYMIHEATALFVAAYAADPAVRPGAAVAG